MNRICKLTDRPIQEKEEDLFGFKERIVDKIYSFLDGTINPIAIAITGEWGGGKSSAINLLKLALNQNKKNLIVALEPLLEGRFDIPDILQLFYLQLYSKMKNKEPDIGGIIKKLLISLSLLTRTKVSASAHVPGFSDVQVEKDIGKDVDDLLKLWGNHNPKLFSEQVIELNQVLRENSYKLYVIIDEIDRLTADKIIKFLLFARTLELFDNITCIVAIDYTQVIQKFVNEKQLGFCDYSSAKAYLDKLFQSQFNIHITDAQKINLFFKGLEQFDQNKYLLNIIKSERSEPAEFAEIISYLSTPREIKKWLILIKKEYALLKSAVINQISLLKLFALLVKHPMLYQNLSKHTIKILTVKNSTIQFLLRDRYGINSFGKDNLNINLLLIASLGIKNHEIENDSFAMRLLDRKDINIIECNDFRLQKYAENFLQDVPVHIIILLIEGCADDKKISSYYEFLYGKIDSVLEDLCCPPFEEADRFAFSLSESLRQFSLEPNVKANITLLNHLWLYRCQLDIGDPYIDIILTCLTKYSVEEIISEAAISLSERILCYILNDFGIKNINGKYHIEKLQTANIPETMFTKLLFKNQRTKEAIREILKTWIKKVENSFLNPVSNWFKQAHIINVLYRFIQFGHACGLDKRTDLSNALIVFLKDNNIPITDKKTIIELIVEECKKYQNPLSGSQTVETPLQILFGANCSPLLGNLKDIAIDNDIDISSIEVTTS